MIARSVVIGGGRGLMQVIPGLLGISGHVTAIVATSDDSGSTGRLRRDLEIPAVGDLRRCLLAAGRATGDNDLQPLVEHRFPGTDVEGHTLGNLILAAIANGSLTPEPLSDVVRAAYPIFGVDPARAAVVPATDQLVDLDASTVTGRRVSGQYAISKTEALHELSLLPRDAVACRGAIEAIRDADLVILGPGSLFTSIIAATLPRGIREAVATSSAPTVFLPCLMPEEGEGDVREVECQVAALARHGLLPDVVLASHHHHVLPAVPQGARASYEPRVVLADLAEPASDVHCADRVGEALSRILHPRERVHA